MNEIKKLRCCPAGRHVKCGNGSIKTVVSNDMRLETVRGIITSVCLNGRDNHVSMFIFRLLLAVFSFSEKLSSFALASKVRIILHCSRVCTHFVTGECAHAQSTSYRNV